MSNIRGFTVLELVMIMVIISVLAVSAIPKITSADARVAAQETVEAIRYAQEMAMVHSGQDSDGDGNLDFYRFNITGNAFRVTRADANSNDDIPNPVTGSSAYTSSWSSGVTFGGGVTIDFDSRGLPSNAANVIISVTAGGETVQITVERLTGYARIS